MQAVILSNRRDAYVYDAISTLTVNVTGWDDLVIVDDSGDRDHRAAVAQYGTVVPAHHGQGGGHGPDFRALTDVDLADLTEHLDTDETLAQVALLRGPWFPNEHEHGGVIEARTAEGARFHHGDGLIRHRDHFTGNPSVLPRRTYTRPWPQTSWSESAFGRQLVRDGYQFAYLDRGVMVDHVGVRTGSGY